MRQLPGKRFRRDAAGAEPMAKNLVIVESPAKAKTLGKYLGRDYQVKASVGHVVDLPKSKLGVDIENDFAPEYHGHPRQDEDHRRAQAGREGQGEHLPRARPGPRGRGDRLAHRRRSSAPKRKNVHRVLFNEITKKAVQEALKHPRELDQNLFDAQQARRVLDRLVGYQLSPAALEEGAPRAVRRPRAVGRGAHHRRARARDPGLRPGGVLVGRRRGSRAARRRRSPPAWPRSTASRLDPKKLPRSRTRRASTSVARAACDGAAWTVTKVERKERRRHPTPPFITSRLQQEASRKLGYQPSPHDAHRAAALRGHRARRRGRGRSHHLHAHRLDAHLAPTRIAAVRELHRRALRQATYLPEAAERLPLEEGRAGRPRGDPADVAGVRRRSASRASSSKEELGALHADLEPLRRQPDGAGGLRRRPRSTSRPATLPLPRHRPDHEVRRLHPRLHRGPRRRAAPTTTRTARAQLPPLTEGETLKLLELLPEQHFTQPPPRFTPGDAHQGAGGEGHRPPVDLRVSIMGTILNKEYVVEDDAAAAAPDRARLPGHRPAGRVVPRRPQRRVHRRHGGRARPHRGGPGALGRRRCGASTSRSRKDLEHADESRCAT